MIGPYRAGVLRPPDVPTSCLGPLLTVLAKPGQTLPNDRAHQPGPTMAYTVGQCTSVYDFGTLLTLLTNTAVKPA